MPRGASANPQEIAQFRWDYQQLLDFGYTHAEIARRLDNYDTGNLSKIVSGANNTKPGKGFLRKFYAEFGEELKGMKPYPGLSEDNNELTSMTREELLVYIHKTEKETIQDLKQDKERSNRQIDELLYQNRGLTDSYKDLSKSHIENREINKGILETINNLAKATQELLDRDQARRDS